MSKQFKAGQKVRVTCALGNNFTKGDIVEVARDSSGIGNNVILRGTITRRTDSRFGTVDTQSLSTEQFEAVKEEIKVGDTVRVTQGGWGIAQSNVGKLTTVLAIKGDYADVDATGFNMPGAFGKDNTRISKSLEFVSRLDLTLPVFTAEGTPVTIVTTQGRDEKFPVLAYEGKATQLTKFSLAGVAKYGEARRYLTNEAPKPRMPVTKTVTIALYADGSVHVSSKGENTSPLTMNDGAKKVASRTVTLSEADF